MSEVSIILNGKSYEIGCDPGQEGRILDLASYIDQRLQEISRSGAAYNDGHLMVLTALVLADEIFELQEGGQTAPARASRGKQQAVGSEINKEEEQLVSRILDQLTKRVEGIAQKVQSA
jgi:cell division protein ZapA